MEYKRSVQTVVETPTNLAIADKLFSEEERADSVALVAADPGCGDPDSLNGRVSKGPGCKVRRKVAASGLFISGATRDFAHLLRTRTHA